jgi:phage-related protein
MTWEIEFFVKDNGRCPTKEFLDGLNKRTELPYINNAIKQLSELGYQLGRPHAAPLEQDIYELRVKIIKVNYRLLYFFFDKNKIIITHGIKKKTKEVPPKEITKAVECRSIYISRKENQR